MTKDGILRLGEVKRHYDLLRPGEHCLGGGFYKLDYLSRRLLLNGESSEFGEPAWERVDCIRLSAYYRGLELIYTSWDSWREPIAISDILEVVYE